MLSEKKIRLLYNLSLWIPLITAFIYIVPVCVIGGSIIHDYNNEVFLNYLEESVIYYQSAISCLIICLPTLIDSIISKLPQFIVKYIYVDDHFTLKATDEMTVIRLTHNERLIFVIGVAILSLPGFLTQSSLRVHGSLISGSFNDVALLLTTSPIVGFLSRCERKIFTPWLSFLINIILSIGCALHANGSFVMSYPDAWNITALLAAALSTLAGLISIILFTKFFIRDWNMLKWFRNRYDTVNRCCFFTNQISNSTVITDQSSVQVSIINILTPDESFRRNVVTAHIFAAILNFIANMVHWSIMNPIDGNAVFNFMYVGMATIVIIIEITIRKNEENKNLVSKFIL